MGDRTKATGTSAGILRPDQLADHVDLARMPCSSAVEHWVENYWSLCWDLPPGSSYVSSTLPHPTSNLTVERGTTRPDVGADPVVLTGVTTTRFDVEVTGRAWVFGVKFRPGGLVALTGLSARTLVDRVVPAAGRLPDDVVAGFRRLRASTGPEDLVRAADDAVGRLGAPPDPLYDTLLTLVQDMLADRSLLQVSAVERRHGIARRRLQRLFERYVGVGPKWVLARYRMHDAVTELDAGYDGTLADLAARYGWYDQAHFTRDFTAFVGLTPGQYRVTTEGRPHRREPPTSGRAAWR